MLMKITDFTFLLVLSVLSVGSKTFTSTVHLTKGNLKNKLFYMDGATGDVTLGKPCMIFDFY